MQDVICELCGQPGHTAEAHRDVDAAIRVARVRLAEVRRQAPRELVRPLTECETWLSVARTTMDLQLAAARAGLAVVQRGRKKVFGRRGAGRLQKKRG
jgi:hypothetical protein